MSRSGDRACKFVVGVGKTFPTTYRGLLEARTYAKRAARDGFPAVVGDDYEGRTPVTVRLSCGGGKGSRPIDQPIEVCGRKKCGRV